jgi:hypothetical protein
MTERVDAAVCFRLSGLAAAMEDSMRRTLTSGTIAAASLLAMFAADAGSEAQAGYRQRAPYCAIFYWHTTDCSYYTARQCLTAISGAGGHCTYGLNGPPVFVADWREEAPPSRRTKRHRRD